MIITKLVDDIRGSVKLVYPSDVFSYGRPFDTALAAAQIQTDQWFIHLDPVSNYTINTLENTQSVPATIGFLLQDKPDSTFDKDDNLEISLSIEEIQEQAKQAAIVWMNYFLDNYSYSCQSYSINIVTRIKNVMSGIYLTANFASKIPC